MGFFRSLFGRRNRVAYARYMEELGDHFELTVGPVENVFHELISDVVHVDIHICKPRGIDCTLLFSTGMSAKPMKTPSEAHRYGEVCMALPSDWPLEFENLQDEANYWPIRTLKVLARLPHQDSVAVGEFISIPSSHPDSTPYPGTEFYGVMLAPPMLLPVEARSMRILEGQIVLYMLMPMMLPEMNMKMNSHASSLWDLVTASDRPIEEFLIVNRNRASLV